MQRLKQNSGSSTTAGFSDGGVNDSLAKNSSADQNLFTSPINNMNELMDSVGPRHNDGDSSQQNEAKLIDSSSHFTKVPRCHKQGQSEMTSGEFRGGNLSGILKESGMHQLLRAHSGVASKENLVDISTTSSSDKMKVNNRQKQLK